MLYDFRDPETWPAMTPYRAAKLITELHPSKPAFAHILYAHYGRSVPGAEVLRMCLQRTETGMESLLRLAGIE